MGRLGEILWFAVGHGIERLVSSLDRRHRLPDVMAWDADSVEAVLLAYDPCHLDGMPPDAYRAAAEVVPRLCPLDTRCGRQQMEEALEAALGRVRDAEPRPGRLRRAIERLLVVQSEAHQRWV